MPYRRRSLSFTGMAVEVVVHVAGRIGRQTAGLAGQGEQALTDRRLAASRLMLAQPLHRLDADDRPLGQIGAVVEDNNTVADFAGVAHLRNSSHSLYRRATDTSEFRAITTLHSAATPHPPPAAHTAGSSPCSSSMRTREHRSRCTSAPAGGG